jgi:putative DNA-invertase from lambdoid prophage Rac
MATRTLSRAAMRAPALARQIFAYCRVSTARQANEGESLDVQRRQIEGYALMHSLTIAECVVEEGVSGSIPVTERLAGGPLLAKLQRGDILIAAKLDRLFRSAIDALTIVADLKARGVHLHLLDLGGDIANGLSKLFFTIASAFAEAERDRIRERVQQSKDDSRRRGMYLGGHRPFGFVVSEEPGEEGKLVPHDREQRTIRQIVAMRRRGGTLRSISESVSRGGISITHEGVRKVLQAQKAGG